ALFVGEIAAQEVERKDDLIRIAIHQPPEEFLASYLVEDAQPRQLHSVEPVATINKPMLATGAWVFPKDDLNSLSVLFDVLAQLPQLAFRHHRKQIGGRLDLAMTSPTNRPPPSP